MICEFVHENVHETPDFTPISGVFRAFLQIVTCTTKNRLSRKSVGIILIIHQRRFLCQDCISHTLSQDYRELFRLLLTRVKYDQHVMLHCGL